MRIVEAVFPARLGTGFRWLIGSSWLSNLGDGITLAAGPLLVASLTDDARLVALAATVQYITGAEVVAPGLRRVGQGKG